MPGMLCEHCTGLCCRYVALPIETPENRQDFDDIRWYLVHEGMSVFIEDGDWFLNIQSTCRHLQPDQRCRIYHTRPRICREYSVENCDYHSGDYGWEEHFTCPEHLDEYFKNHGPGKGRRRRSARNGKPGRPRLRAKLRTRNPKKSRYTRATADVSGVPLPVLGAGR